MNHHSNYHSALQYADKVVKLLSEKGVKLIDTSIYRYEPYRTIEEWVLKLKTNSDVGVRVIFNLNMNIEMMTNRIFNMIKEEENHMCYTSLFNDGRSHAMLIINKANGEANRKLIQEGLIKGNEEGIFIDSLDFDEVLNDWVVTVVHQYSGAEKAFKYPVTEDMEDLTLKMINGWKQDKELI